MKNLFIVDLEATCFPRGAELADFTSEILEIGAVVFDTTARMLDDGWTHRRLTPNQGVSLENE